MGKKVGVKYLNKRITMGCWINFFSLVISVPILFLIFLSLYYTIKYNIPSLRHNYPVSTALMQFRSEQNPALKIYHQIIPYDSIPVCLIKAVVISEDHMFFKHNGVNWEEIKNAIKEHFIEGKKLRGASTITQQLSKNLFLTPERTIYRKLKELCITYSLEFFLSKKRILELYLNSIELGPGIFGIETAANHYFSCSIRSLNGEKQLMLVAIIPRPLLETPTVKTTYITKKLKRLRQFCLYPMHYLTPEIND